MALVLTMKEGEDFYVRENHYVIDTIMSDTKFRMKRDDGETFNATVGDAVKLEPDVYVSAGEGAPCATVRVVVAAPRSITVIRGETVRRKVPA